MEQKVFISVEYGFGGVEVEESKSEEIITWLSRVFQQGVTPFWGLDDFFYSDDSILLGISMPISTPIASPCSAIQTVLHNKYPEIPWSQYNLVNAGVEAE